MVAILKKKYNVKLESDRAQDSIDKLVLKTNTPNSLYILI